MSQLEDAVNLCEQTLQRLSSESPKEKAQGIESVEQLLANPYISYPLKQKLRAQLQALETAKTETPAPEPA